MTNEPDNISSKQNPVGRFMVAAGAVIEQIGTGKILIVQRNNDLDWKPSEWEICYGRIDQFEDVEAGLKREISEELGIHQLTVVSVLRVWHLFRGTQKAENELIGITFYCRTNSESVIISKEHSQYRWVTPQEALQLIAVDGIKEDIQKYIDFISTFPNSYR